MKIPMQVFYYLCFIILAFILYGQTISYGFTNFDDNLILEINADIFKTEVTFADCFTTDAFLKKGAFAFYRPLQNLTFWLEIKITGGINPWIFHLTNIIIFILFGCALFRVLLKFNIPDSLAFWGTCLYITHPLFTFSVAWIPARGDLLLSLFSVLSIIDFVRFVNTNKIKDLLSTFLFFTLALFSKETAAFLPFIYLLYFYLMQKNHKILFSHFLLGGLMLLAGLAWYFLRINSTDMNANTTKFVDVLFSFQNIPTAISQFFIPFEFSPIPAFSESKNFLGCCFIVILIVIGITFEKKQRKSMLFFGLWFIILLIPAFLFKSYHYQYLDHRYMLPLVGILAIIIFWLKKYWESKNKGFLRVCFIMILIVFSFITLIKVPSFKNPEIFYETVIKHNPKSSVAYNNRSKFKEKKGNLKGAIADLDKAIALDDFYSYYAERGLLRAKTNNFKGAIADFDKAEDLQQRGSDINCVNRGFAYHKLGFYDKAIKDYNDALSYGQSSIEVTCNAYLGKAYAYFALKDYQKCIEACDEVLKINPEDESAISQRNKAQNAK